MNRREVLAAALLAPALRAGAVPTAFPGQTWETRPADELGMSPSELEGFWRFVGGRGCVARHGYLVQNWGDPTVRADVASAAHPLYGYFLFKALEEKKILSLDAPAATLEPRLKDLNAPLGRKDSRITWRHLATQTSCYGVQEEPGKAFDYSDRQLALFWDLLFLKVFGSSPAKVDEQVLGSGLGEALAFEDKPTLLAFGPEDRVGRLAISPRDYARFGLLYLRGGQWRGRQMVSRAHVQLSLTSPLPNSLPRTTGQAAEMLPGQRTLGSRRIPDDQTDHLGSYSYFWWTNGTDRDGRRHWPDAPPDTCAALGHFGGEALILIPSLDLVISWNESRVGTREAENEALRRITRAAIQKPDRDRVSGGFPAP
jgi:CubicO group peptidase (beta-lactamase class C family)